MNDIIGYTIGQIAKRKRDEKVALARFNDKEVSEIDPALLYELYSACIVMGKERAGAVVLNYHRRVERGGAA